MSEWKKGDILLRTEKDIKRWIIVTFDHYSSGDSESRFFRIRDENLTLLTCKYYVKINGNIGKLLNV